MPHARISTGLLAALLATAGAASAAAATPAQPDIQREQAQIKKIVADISPKRIEAHIRKLVSFGTRNTLSDQTSATRAAG